MGFESGPYFKPKELDLPMTNSYFNAVSGAAATPAPIFSSHDLTDSAAQTASVAPRAPIAPWVQSGFVAIPVEFFRVAIGQLSKRAQSLYFLHCSHANARGENAGLSYCYRETLARELNCSLDTVDRANLELEKHGLIEDAGRRYRHGGAVVYRLNPPARWKFKTPQSPVKSSARAARKTAALRPQLCVGEAAVLRPITRDTEHLKAKEQQTAPSQNLNRGALEGTVVVVEKTSFEKTEKQAPAKPANQREQSVYAALERQGFKAAMAQRLVTQYGVEACAYQLKRLEGQNAVRSRTGWLVAALKEGDRDEIAPVATPVQEKTAPPSLTPDQRAQRLARVEAHQKEQHEVAARVLAGLDVKRQTYIGRCVQLERLSLAEVIKREEHGAFSVTWNHRTSLRQN